MSDNDKDEAGEKAIEILSAVFQRGMSPEASASSLERFAMRQLDLEARRVELDYQLAGRVLDGLDRFGDRLLGLAELLGTKSAEHDRERLALDRYRVELEHSAKHTPAPAAAPIAFPRDAFPVASELDGDE